MEFIWLIKLLLAHLLTDFVLQPSGWVLRRKQKHFASPFLYYHTLLTGLVAWLFLGFHHWGIALTIFITHTLIDGWKSYKDERASWFLIDQLLHILVIAVCWYLVFVDRYDLSLLAEQLDNPRFWITSTAFVFVAWPAGILIGKLTMKWRDRLTNHEALSQAGKWIGIIERVIILIFVLHQQYEGLGLLVAAKALLRFNEKDRPEPKTEYLLIGTLISIGIALVTGLIVLELTSH